MEPALEGADPVLGSRIRRQRRNREPAQPGIGRLAQLRRDNPLSVFNPNWDSRRLWITGFVESQRRLKIDGNARDGEDVSELARRLNLSSFFYDVKLLPATRDKDFVKFSIEAKVRY